jgi:predicted RNA-binding Zn ribbon-like protein
MSSESTAPSPFDLSGGALSLDLANTVGDRPTNAEEKLAGFEDLLRWATEAGVVASGDAGRLATEAAARSGQARSAFRRALDLREVIYRIFSSLARGGKPETEDLDRLNQALTGALRHLRVREEADGFGWTWADPGTRFDQILWPVIRDAAELLTSAEAEHVRECASDRCSWLFVDRSRTHRRRWCDMKVCGNRAKAQRHYRRKKGTTRG